MISAPADSVGARRAGASPEWLNKILYAATRSGIIDPRLRIALLVNIDARVVGLLPNDDRPLIQMASDLTRLNCQCAGGAFPLATWLNNAISLLGNRPGTEIFDKAHAEILRITGCR